MPDTIVEENSIFPTDCFSASSSQTLVEIGYDVCQDNKQNTIDDATYRITGSIGDGRLSWVLHYVRYTQPSDVIEEKIGIAPWEKMSWLVFMLGAYVSGTITTDGKKYELHHSPGQHDHNWGEWISGNVLWNWAQYFEPRLALALALPDLFIYEQMACYKGKLWEKDWMGRWALLRSFSGNGF